MSILKDAERSNAGNELAQLFETGTQALSRLSEVKTKILALKAKVETDTDTFTSEDATEVTAKITLLAQAINDLV